MHLIIVRDDLAYIIHQHPPVGPNGLLRQTVTFPAPGPYRVLVDVYPNLPGVLPNFQLFRTINVDRVTTARSRCRAFKPDLVVDGYHFDMQGHPPLHAIQAQFMHVDVTDPQWRARSRSCRGSARSPTRSSSSRGRSTTSTPTSARPNAPNCGEPARACASSANHGQLDRARQADDRRAAARARAPGGCSCR